MSWGGPVQRESHGGPKRRNRFILGRVWSLLRKHPGTTTNAMAERLVWSKQRMRNAMQNLRRAGYARSEGRGRNDIWFAVGNVAPEAKWGLHPNSLANLEHTPEERDRRLKLAGEALGWDVSPKQKVVRAPRHVLDACWSQLISGKKAA